VWILNSYLQCAHLLLKFSPSRIVQVLPFERLRNYVLSILVCPLSRLYICVCVCVYVHSFQCQEDCCKRNVKIVANAMSRLLQTQCQDCCKHTMWI